MDPMENKEAPWWMPDARSWIGMGVFAVTIMLLQMMRIRELREDEFFQTIATMVISSGFLAIVAWAYSATKGGGEQAAKNAVIAENLAKSLPHEPQPVTVVNPPSDPVPTTNGGEDLPDYAKP